MIFLIYYWSGLLILAYLKFTSGSLAAGSLCHGFHASAGFPDE